MLGLRFVGGNLRLDLAALNKVETLLWDLWAEWSGDGDAETFAIYDEAASVTADDVDFAAARTLFLGQDRLRTPPVVLTESEFHEPREVTLRLNPA